MSRAAVPLHGYQQRWFKNRSRFKAGMFARQTGKTFTTSLEIVDDCFEAITQGRAERWVILSRGERQAREVIEEGIKRHAAAYQLGVQSLESDFVGAEGTYKQLEVVLPGGSRITALPANPDTARGFSANCFLDEFAFHADSKKIWGALFPVISKPGLKLRVVSTPNGKGNKFYELMTGKDEAWYRQTVDIHQAVADGLPRDIALLKSALNDPDIWAQEFELEWLDEASAWLSYDLINGCEHDLAGDASQYQGGPCFVGVDIAAVRDLFVIVVLELVGDVLWVRELIAVRRIKFAEQDELLDAVMKRYKVSRLWMDQTGMGMKPVEDAQRWYGANRVHGVMFTPAAKQDLAIKGKEAFEDRKIRIPMGDQALRSDLHKLKRETTPTGATRFVAERDAGGHADRAWGMFLGIAAAAFGGMEIDYTPAPQHPRGMDNATADGRTDDVPEQKAW